MEIAAASKFEQIHLVTDKWSGLRMTVSDVMRRLSACVDSKKGQNVYSESVTLETYKSCLLTIKVAMTKF